MRRLALFDLLILLTIFWLAWSLRFLGIGQIGALTMGAGAVVGLVIIRVRKLSWQELGFQKPKRADIRVAFEAAAVIPLAFLALPLITATFGPLETSSAISEQPIGLADFLIDLFVFTWLAAGLGEEFFFRGLVFARLRTFLGNSLLPVIVAASLQAVWFGAGHASQGLSGMVLTGLIGFGLAMVFYFRAERSLLPLIVAHIAIDTLVLSISYLS